MIDEDTVIMAIGDNRSFQYLQENPKAIFIVIEPGSSPTEWKGARKDFEASLKQAKERFTGDHQ
jgi:hypothetical protein